MADSALAATDIPTFSAPYAGVDEDFAARFLTQAQRAPEAEARIGTRASSLIDAIRSRSGGIGGVEDFLHAYALSTKEGLALMVLAEALLRVPDAATADRLIEDKLAAGDWVHASPHSGGLLVSASAWTLGLTTSIIHPGETPEGIIDALVKRLGLPAVRLATRQAMRLLGSHFVLGQTIEDALARGANSDDELFSFDMLGEGARTAADAERYFRSYAHAIEAIGKSAGHEPLPNRAGISVKLSALHPRYEPLGRERILAELVPKLLKLARAARRHELNFTVDAEEADRLELSLEVIAAIVRDPSLTGWHGFGLAIQAYQKRAGAVIEWIDDVARALDRRFMVRLVKGAYWDTEIKRAQERGIADYPVFTRKAMTDLCYLDCAHKLLAARPRIYPQFATHNALTVAAIIEDAGVGGYEFQRLHGMGESLYRALRSQMPEMTCRVYAPVGGHADLLAYLVRRLLENGANSSFVALAGDRTIPISQVVRRPEQWIGEPDNARHPRIPLPRDLYQPERKNSAGVEFGERASLERLLAEICRAPAKLGPVRDRDTAVAMQAAQSGFPAWNESPLATRAAALDCAADLFEAQRGRFIALLQSEGGKTLDDCVSEVRETADYCRYYAAQARRTLAPQPMPGPTGESNELHYRGRGVFVCISPWNFPLAIFTGQVVAALVAGNVVVAKPAEQTPMIAREAVGLLHRAGIPESALHLVPGGGKTGAALVADPRCAGVAFTGSTEVGRTINRALAAKDGPIAPLIAETGGINAMIADATALPEQVTDDVITSAFRSAGQRCSALRLLCVQDDVADKVLTMVAGAARELVVGDPRDPATQVGPVIDRQARDRLMEWLENMERRGAVRFRWDSDRPLPADGLFVPPSIVELTRVRDLTEEVFGPILHVVRWDAGNLDRVIDEIAENGYGLTLGIHSRIDETVRRIIARLDNGNIYVNRSMIGAVVGTQPFGGSGLSGTGPKAGGPNYLHRFALEQVVTVNTAAAGGNAALLSAEE